MEYKGFTIVDMGWGYHVYGTSSKTVHFGFVRTYETIEEAEKGIDNFLNSLQNINIKFN